jgi:acyl-coenzyme A synthetase/AMP-(fatty) acid ligase
MARDLANMVSAMADESQPDWVALESAGRTVTIRRLSQSMLSVAAALDDAAGGVVTICEPDPIRHTIAVLGAIAAGRPAALVDHRHPDALLSGVVADTSATCCLGRHVDGVDHLSVEDLVASAPPPRAGSPSALALESEAPGTIFLTSGTTGRPKLVLRSRGADVHAAMCVALARFPIEPGDRHWLAVPCTSAAFLTLVMGSLLKRATVVFAPFVREAVNDTLVEHDISSVYLVPTMLRLAREEDGLRGPGWDGLRGLATGGERLDDDTAAILLDRFRSRVFCAYGMTECPRVTEATLQEVAERPGTVGRAIPLRQVKISSVDGGVDVDVDAGVEGEVLVRGPDMFSGYLGAEPAEEWYRTGDFGRLDDDGYLYITGRGSAVVKVAGNRVSTDEISAVLSGHPDVAQAAVIAVTDELWSHRLEAFAVLRPGRQLTEAALAAWLSERVARYQIPRALTFLDAMPIDRSGKVSLRTLHDLVSP